MRGRRGKANPVPLQPEQLRAELFMYFRHCGYVRRPRWPGGADDPDREREWQVRFVLDCADQQRELQRLLQQAGFGAPRLFRHAGFPIVALSGPQAVEEFRSLWDSFRDTLDKPG
jgi:hypothetical protein